MKFQDLSIYFENIFNELSKDLYQRGQIEKDLKYKYFFELGEYKEETINPQNLDEETEPEVFIRIADKGRLQDPQIAINTYVWTIGMEFQCFKDQVYDLNTVISSFFNNYRAKQSTITYNTNDFEKIAENNYDITFTEKTDPIFINVNSTNEWTNIEVGGEDKFATKLDIIVTIYENAQLSNFFSLYINGVYIPYDTATFIRDTALVSDLTKTNDTQFFSNSSVFSLTTTGLLVNSNANPALATMFYDCTNNTRFNQFYEIDLKDTNNDSIPGFPKNMYSKTLKFDLINSSIIKYTAQFYKGVNIG